jgi:pimeloyl-ACP methyl ester carboxylesterase
MNRAGFMLTAAGALVAGTLPIPARAAESDIELKTATGTIDGTLSLPATSLPVPVVLIIAGSGPVDRDGNEKPVLMTNAYRLIAQAMLDRGIATVRYDKRGIGASAKAMPSESDIRFESYIADATAWIEMLRADKRFSRVIVAGHSEGSLVGMIAAREAPADAFVSLEGMGRPFATVLSAQLRTKLPPKLYAQSNAILSSLQRGNTVSNVPSDLSELYRPSVQPYLISVMKYDPSVEIAKLTAPITIVQGTADVQVTMDDASALAKAAPGAKLVIVDGMDHVLKQAGSAPSGMLPEDGYTDPSKPVEPVVIGAIAHAAKS